MATLQKIWVIQLDPETESIDPERETQSFMVYDKGEYYLTADRERKIFKDSMFIIIFDNQDHAIDYRYSALIGLRKKYRSALTVISNEIRNDRMRMLKKPQEIIRLIYPDGRTIECTRRRASEIADISLSGVAGVLKRGNTTRKGFFMERIEE